MKSCLIIAALVITLPSMANAAELNLACQALDVNRLESRQVLIGKDNIVRALKSDSGRNPTLLHERKYAVVIEWVLGSGNEVAYEEWSVRKSSEFSLLKVSGLSDYYFNDKLTGVPYICSLNTDVRPNPAMSRSN